MEKAKKKGFKMPHLLWIMVGLILMCSLLTYIIPAGQYGVDENGAIIGSQFQYLGYQTPVSPMAAFLSVHQGMVESGTIIFIVMICGACIEVSMATKCFDKLLDWAIYRFKDSGQTLLITVMFCLMVYLGAFGGSDALIAIVPVGILFAKKMRLDPICAMAMSTFATLIGFGTGPTKTMIVQGLMGTRVYGAFVSRFIFMNGFMVIGLFMVLAYVKKIQADPRKSLMYQEGWRPGEASGDGEIKNAAMNWRIVANLGLFIGQFAFVVVYGLMGGPYDTYAVMAAVMMGVAVVQGIIARMSADEIGNIFVKGIAGMAFVGFVIGMARTVSIVLANGSVLHTIVHILTIPLMNLPSWVATIGMMLVITLINPMIPSATSKAAILIPIVKPIGQVLGLAPEMIVQAFQFGDGFTNIISPLLGWTVGSLAMAGVSIQTWMKWALPKVLFFIGTACLILFGLTMAGWTGAF